MDSFFDVVIENLKHVNWEGPAAFVVAIMAVFAFMRKWSLLLLVILTIAIGWGAENLIILNLDTDNEMISLPLLVYAIGGVCIFLLALYSFFKPE